MAKTQIRSRRKLTGGRYRDYRKKRQSELGRDSRFTLIGKRKAANIRVIGGNKKEVLFSEEMANVLDPKTKKVKKAKIKVVVENKANVNFVRRNIITKGTIIETELGKARITNRPGQEGQVNAVLI
ncbi:MAG TPA: 30S ribosomal protein S8e [Candidatus Nanoarchaeia archaeon]|nr:30S ribosomal protein S8e [Candidatus Nanoarchaeia archaeon]